MLISPERIAGKVRNSVVQLITNRLFFACTQYWQDHILMSYIFSFFSLLIKRANVWLRLYNHVKVKTCESITCESDRGCIDTETSILFEYGIGDCPHIRALR